jgi:hypothetical protein
VSLTTSHRVREVGCTDASSAALRSSQGKSAPQPTLSGGSYAKKGSGATTAVVFTSAESNAVDIRTYTGPSRAAGWAWLLGGAASGGFGFYLAGKADSAPNEKTRDDVKTLSYGFLGLGAAAAALAVYLLTVPHEEKVVATFASASAR